MRRIEIEHLCRVEGFGGVYVELDGDQIREVRVNVMEGPRMFEAVVLGRRFDEIPPIVTRICAICSAIHCVTSTMAVENALGVQVTEQTKLLRELLVHGGNIESHALHIFCLALPDFLGYNSVIEMAADHPDAVAKALRLKKLGNTIQERIGGRMVHQTNVALGGFGRLPGEDELRELRGSLEKGLVEAMEMMELLSTVQVPDYPTSPTLYAALEPEDGFGYFGDKIALSTGERFDVSDYKAVCNERVVPYSHAKHSRFNGRPFMVGSLARVMINGHKLTGSLEIVDRFLKDGIRDEKPVPVEPKSGKGTAAGEAPRGTLYHSYEFDENGRAVSADIITPTAQNYANMEKDVRASLERIKGESDEEIKFKINMVIRAYDPCISCSVHLVRI